MKFQNAFIFSLFLISGCQAMPIWRLTEREYCERIDRQIVCHDRIYDIKQPETEESPYDSVAD